MNELRDIFTKYKAVVFFDTETTGLEAESCQIIELAAIRVEKTERGTLRMADSADVFVKLPEGERIPQKIVELTGITDEQLENEGITEAEAAARFTELISGGRVLLVAHNAQFDLLSLPQREDCVIVGRCATNILKDKSLKLFIHAPFEERIQNVIRRTGREEASARKLVKKMDKERKAYYEYFTDSKWLDMTQYDLCIDSSRFSMEQIIEIVKRCL